MHCIPPIAPPTIYSAATLIGNEIASFLIPAAKDLVPQKETNEDDLSTKANKEKIENIVKEVFDKHINECQSYLKLERKITDEEFDQFLLTKFLSKAERYAINNAEINIDEVHKFISLLQSRDGIVTILNEYFEKIPLYAIFAYIKTQLITKYQVASLIYLCQARDNLVTNRKIYVNTFDDCLNQNITQQFSIQGPSPSFIMFYYNGEQRHYLKTFFKMNATQFECFLRRMEKKPVSEQYFFGFPLPLHNVGLWNPLFQMLIDNFPHLVNEPVLMYLNHNIEEGLYKKPHKMMIIPSMAMIIEMNRAIYGTHEVGFEPVIGEPTLFKMRNKRVIKFGIQQSPTPEFVDDIYCRSLGFTIIQFCILTSDNLTPYLERLAISHIVERILIPMKNQEVDDFALDILFSKLYSTGEKFGHLFTNFKWNTKIKKIVLRDFARLRLFWKLKFGIDEDSFLETEKNYLNSIQVTKEEEEEALIKLFQFYLNKPKETSLYLLNELMKIKKPISNYLLGRFYYNRFYHAKAYAYFKEAVRGKYFKAYIDLGILYQTGRGVEKNHEQALKCYTIAQKRGFNCCPWVLNAVSLNQF